MFFFLFCTFVVFPIFAVLCIPVSAILYILGAAAIVLGLIFGLGSEKNGCAIVLLGIAIGMILIGCGVSSESVHIYNLLF